MDPIYLTHETTSVSGTSPLGPSVSFTGTISGVRVLMPNGNLSGETQTFDLYKNGSALSTGLEVPDGDNEDTVTGLSEAATDDDVFQFYITAPVADSMPVPPYNFTIVLAETHVDLTTNQTIAGNKTPTGAWDFGGATSLEIPNSATPTVNADGEIAVDTSVADFSHGIVKVYAGEELALVAMPVAELTTPTDGHVVAYNATNDEFELVAQSGGSGDVATDAIFDAKGDLAVGTGADTADNLTVGANDTILMAASGETTGLKWGDASTVRTALGLATGDSPQFTAINLGHASDTTLARSGAGDVTIEGNGIYRAGGTDVPLADGGTGASLSDPGADRVMFWDDSAGAVTWLTVGSNLTITDTTISASGGGGAGTFNIDDGTAAAAGTFTFDDGTAA